MIAFAAQTSLVQERSANTIIICTPNGPKLIEWDFLNDRPAQGKANPLCPLCLSVANVSTTQLGAKRSVAVQYEAFAPPVALRVLAFGEYSPYPARAPPL